MKNVQVKGRFTSGAGNPVVVHAERHEIKVVDSLDDSLYVIFHYEADEFRLGLYNVNGHTLDITDTSASHVRVDSANNLTFWLEVRVVLRDASSV